MSKAKLIETVTKLDEYRVMKIERRQMHRNRKVGKFYITLENYLTDSLFRLPGLTIEDLRKMLKDAEGMEKVYQES